MSNASLVVTIESEDHDLESSVTTSIQLQPLPQSEIQQRDTRHHEAPDRELSDIDPVLEASRAADNDVPDGGYAWVVIFASAIVCFWFTGNGNYTWGVIQNALLEQKLASAATLSFIGSLSPTIMAALAIINARVIRWLGIRVSAILGIVLLGVAQLTSGFSTHSVAGQFITRGVGVGLGMSLCFMVTSTIPAQYFSRKRGLANGIVSAGGGLGAAVLSYVLDALIQRFGVQWAYRIVGIMTLVTGLPAAWIMKERTTLPRVSFIEWRLFKDLKFVLIFVAGAIATFPLLVPAFFLPFYSTSIKLPSSTGAALLSGYNFSSAVGRILGGFCSDNLGPLNTLIISLILSAVSMLALWPASTTLIPLAFFAIINGASNGMYFATVPTAVGNIFGSARVSVALGMIVTGWGAGYLMGAPIAGYILDEHGGSDAGLKAFRPAMFYAGSLAMGATGFLILMRSRISSSLLAKL
ncbi:MFS general substrate transporter [Trichoderma sp. SZMC 28011]